MNNRKGAGDDRRLIAQFFTELRRSRKDPKTPELVQHMRFVVQMAMKLRHSAAAAGLSPMDLIQEGYEGLVKTDEKFDPDRGITFSTYTRWWIRAAMMNAIADSAGERGLRVSRSKLEQLRNFKKTITSMTNVLGRPPTHAEIIAEGKRAYDMKPVQVTNTLKLGDEKSLSLDGTPSDTNDDDQRRLENTLVVNAATPEDRAVNSQAIQRLLEAVSQLPEREHLVMTKRYGLEDGNAQSLAAIGRDLKLSRERIRQIEAKAILLLQEALAEPPHTE